jgi:ArsR family transcriptional regulator
MLFERECCVCEIIEVLGISQPRASHHLGAMYTAGLLKMRRVGIYALYSIDWDNVDGYTVDILKAVRGGIDDNPAARADVMKLWAAQRLIPEYSKQA